MSTITQTKKQHYKYGFKLSHNIIKNMNAMRLQNHLIRLRRSLSSFHCECCHMLLCDIHDYSDERKKDFMDEYEALQRYIKFINKEYHSKKDDKFKQQSAAIENRKESRYNKGHQKKSHSKRRSLKAASIRREKYLEMKEKEMKIKRRDVLKKVATGKLPETALRWI